MAFLILVPSVLIFFRPTKADAAWFDDNYSYRQKFSFTHNADIPSGRAITFSLDTATLITAGVMQADCDDTRFTDINGKLLRFQLTGTCNNAATTYMVVFPSIINGTNPAFVYYGNPTAASASVNVSSVTALTPSGSDPAITNRANEEKSQTPILSWKFDEGYGTTAYDGSQYQNNGALTGGVTWQNEDLCLFGGKCLQFDGVNANVQKTYSSDKELDVGTASMSASLWYKHPNSISATQYLVSRYTTTAPAGGYKIYMKSTGVVCFAIDDDSIWNPDDEACDTVSTADSKWHHVEVVKSEGSQSITIYRDGKQARQKTSLTATGSLSGNSPTLYVGIDSDGTGSPWNGFIDQVKIYNFAKTADQAKTDFTNKGSVDQVSVSFGSSDPDSSLNQGLAAYWKMDDGVNNPCASGVDKACDSSGNGNIGAWKNGVASTSGKFANATNYDGTDDYFEAATVNGTNKNEETVSAWIRPTTVTGNHVVIDLGHGGFSVQDDLLIRQSGTNISFRLWNGNNYDDITASGVLAANTWTHVVALHSVTNTRSEFYVNGELKGTMNTNKDSSNNHSFVNIGRDFQWLFPTDYFMGQIDDVRVYNRPLSPVEVRSLADWGPEPIGWWTLDERTGTTAHDVSGNANTGTLTNGPKWTAGKLGQGLSLDGVDDFVLVPDSASLDVTNITISLWVNKQTANLPSWGPLVSRENRSISTARYWIGYDNTANDAYRFYDTWTNNVAGPASTNDVSTWVHLVGTSDGTTLRLYQNGVQVASAPAAGPVAVGSEAVCFGTNSTDGIDCNHTDFAAAGLDDVRIYNYALTPKQVVSVMNAGHPAVGSPVGSALGHWKLDEGYGTTANNSGSCATCSATLNNSPVWKNEGKFGKALHFNGSNQSVTTTLNTDPGDKNTLSAWVYPVTSAASKTIITASKLTTDSSSRPTYGNCTGTALPLNQWTHIVAVSNTSGDCSIYQNAVQTANSTSGVAFGNSVNIAASSFSGMIDEVKIYNYSLNADEVKVEYNQGKGVVMGALSTNPNGYTASNSAERAYCPPGNAETNCAASLNPAPVGHWNLDERIGTSANDISGNNNTGTLTNGPVWTAGKFGQGLNFDGSNDYVTMGDINAVDGLTQITVSSWVKTTSQSTERHIVDKSDCSGAADTGVFELLEKSDNLPAFLIYKNGGTPSYYAASSTTAINDGQWHHVTGTYDGSNVRIYVDGVNTGSTAISGITFPSVAQPVELGGRCNNQFFTWNGGIDDVRIYNYARTPAQIAWEYNRGKPIAHWKFDECTGTTANDSSGKGNNGTITIGATGSNTSAGNCSTVDTATAWYNGRTGKYNSSLNFDGTDDYVDAGNLSSLRITGSLTLSAWVKADTFAATTDDEIISKFGVTEKSYQLYATFDNSVRQFAIILRNPANTADIIRYTNTNPTTGQWYHVAGVYNASAQTLDIYVNGMLDNGTLSGTVTSSIFASTTSVSLGARPTSSRYWDGQIDDARIYNYALTPTQVRTLYNENSALRFGPAAGSP